jgi:putative peptide zinc metalloprotease protein
MVARKGTMTQEKAPANGGANTAGAVPERPSLAPDVQLLGEMRDTGFADRQWLVGRGGRFVQTTEILYRVAEQANGERTLAEIAAGVTASTDRLVGADDVRRLIADRLVPLGLIAAADGPEDAGPSTAEERERSILQIRAGVKVLGPGVIDPISRGLQVLHAPPVVVLFLVAAALAHGWLYLYAARDVLVGLYQFIYNPALILVTVPLMIAVTIFHEFGHASALRYGGGEVRGIGVGIYITDPVIYTDTTDNYRLGRWARLRTDLGGFYFWLIAQLAIVGAYLVSGQEFLLFLVALIDAEILFQLLPFARFDGYWALASLTGIPDLLSRMRATEARGAGGSRGPGSSGNLPELKPWVKVVFGVWAALTVPVMALFVILFVLFAPRFLAAFWDSFLRQAATFSAAMVEGDALGMAVAGLHVFVIALNIFIMLYFAYLLVRIPLKALWARRARGRRAAVRLLGVRAAWEWGKRTPARRAVGLLVVAFGIVGSTFLWAPGLTSIAGRTPPEGVRSFENLGSEHTESPVSYGQTPPVGGNHAPVWQNCGFYAEPVRAENAVHSMEHGAVWITYRPGLPEERLEPLRELARVHDYVLASPYPDLPSPVVASAWGKQLRLDSAGDPRLDRFVRAFRLGPQTPEPGAPCSGGTGSPV